MAQRLLRTFVLGMLTFALLFGGGPAATGAVHADPHASSVARRESSLSQPNEQFELRSTIAFASSRDNPTGAGLPWPTLRERGKSAGEIYLMLMNPDGTPVQGSQENPNPRRVTNNVNYDAFPDLSPDGKKIVFDSNLLGAVDAPTPEPTCVPACTNVDNVDLFVMNADGSDQQHLTRGGSSTWDPRGKYVAYHASQSGTRGPFKTSLSAATADSDIFVVNVDDCRQAIEQSLPPVDDCRKIPGPHVKNITNSVGFVDDDPDWSRDGTKIVYTRHPVSENAEDNVVAPLAEIWVMRVNPDGTPVPSTTDDTNPKQLTFTAGITEGISKDRCPAGSTAPCPAEERIPTWSADGTRIAFARRTGSGVNGLSTWVMNADGTNPVQLRFNDLLDGPGSWSPDGTRIVFFEGATTGSTQLWSMNANGTDAKQLTFPLPPPSPPGANATPNWGLLRVKVQAPAVTQPAGAPAALPVPKR